MSSVGLGINPNRIQDSFYEPQYEEHEALFAQDHPCDSRRVTESRIIMDDDLQQIQHKLQCGICFQLVTLESKPLECSQCHNQIYCTACYKDWARINKMCPYCKTRNAEMVSPGPLLISIIKSLKFTCKFKEKGCNTLCFKRDLTKHEATCSYNNEVQSGTATCQLCGQKRSSAFDDEEIKESERHICCKTDIMKLQCDHHKRQMTKFTDERIENKQVVKSTRLFQCNICHNLLCQPVYCTHCLKYFCTICITNGLMDKNYCPNCYVSNPKLSQISRNDMHIFSVVKLKCKNYDKGCDKVYPFNDLANHEEQCTSCPNCRTKCGWCKLVFTCADIADHNCPVKEEQAKKALLDQEKQQQQQQAAILNGELNRQLLLQAQPIHDYRPHYFRRIANDVSDNISRGGTYKFEIPVIILDFIFQNAMLFFYIYYYLMESFLSEDGRKTYLAFIILYYSAQLLPMLSVALFNRYSNIGDEHVCRRFWGKTLLSLSTLVHGQYMYIAFGPLFVDNLGYGLTSGMGIAIVFSRAGSLVVQFALIAIQSFNEVNDWVKGVTIGLTSFSFIFNAIVAVCFGK